MNSLNNVCPYKKIYSKGLFRSVISRIVDIFTRRVLKDRHKHFVVSLLGSKLKSKLGQKIISQNLSNLPITQQVTKMFPTKCHSEIQTEFSFVQDAKLGKKYYTPLVYQGGEGLVVAELNSMKIQSLGAK